MSSPAPTYSWQTAAQQAAQAAGATLGQVFTNSQVSGNTAASLASAAQMNNQNLGQNQAQFNANMALRQSEMARRNMMQGAAAPSTLNALGYRNPADIARLQAQFSQQQQPADILGTPKPTATSGNSPAAADTGTYQMPNSPNASAIIGGGRKADNNFVQSVENPFGADLATIVKQKDSGDTAGAATALQQKYAQYMAAVQQQIAQGGVQAIAAQQSLHNSGLQQTIQTLAQQLGVNLNAPQQPPPAAG